MRSFDVVVIGAGPAGEVAAGRLAEQGLRSRSSRIGSSAASARSGPVCRRRPCCARTRRWPRPSAIPGAAEAVTGKLDVAAVLARRDEIIHELDDDAAAAVARGARDRADPRPRAAGRRAPGRPSTTRRSRPSAPSSSPPARCRRCRRSPGWTDRRRVDEPRRDDGEDVPGRGWSSSAAAWSASRWRRRSRRSAAGHAGRGRTAADPRRGGPFACIELTAALRDARGGRSGRPEGRGDRAGGDGTVTVETTDGGAVVADEVLVALGAAEHQRSRRRGRRPRAAASRSTSTPTSASPGMTGCTRSATSTARRCSRTWASTRRGSPPTTGSAATRALPRRRRPALAARDLRRAAGRGRRPHDGVREKAGLIVDTFTASTSGTPAASFYGRNAPGTTQWIVDRDRRIVVGCTITGAEIADFLHAATIAIVGEVPLERLKHAIPSFPTRSEIWLQLEP